MNVAFLYKMMYIPPNIHSKKRQCSKIKATHSRNFLDVLAVSPWHLHDYLDVIYNWSGWSPEKENNNNNTLFPYGIILCHDDLYHFR